MGQDFLDRSSLHTYKKSCLKITLIFVDKAYCNLGRQSINFSTARTFYYSPEEIIKIGSVSKAIKVKVLRVVAGVYIMQILLW